MALSDSLARKIAEALVNQVYLGIRTGARRSVATYRENMAQAALLPAGPERTELETDAIGHIRRAVDMPRRARFRIEHAMSKLPGETQAARVAALNAILAVYDPTLTVAEINAELATLEAFAQGLVDDYKANAKTYDDIATAIEAALENEIDRWRFPFPPAYQDIWAANGA